MALKDELRGALVTGRESCFTVVSAKKMFSRSKTVWDFGSYTSAFYSLWNFYDSLTQTEQS